MPESKIAQRIIMIIGSIAIILLAFGAGVAVGYHHGLFALRFGQNYYRNFESAPPPPMGHGTAGVVLDVTTSTIVAQGPDGNEESIAISTDTVIRDNSATIPLSVVVPGDRITVIGRPTGEGQIEARFIRVFDLPTPSIFQ